MSKRPFVNAKNIGAIARRIGRMKSSDVLPSQRQRMDEILYGAPVEDPTISAEALRAVLAERVQDAGSYRKFADKHGLSHNHYYNVVHGLSGPGARVLKILGYVAEPPRYRKE